MRNIWQHQRHTIRELSKDTFHRDLVAAVPTFEASNTHQKVKITPAIDKMPPRPDESLARMDRVESSPNLTGLKSMKRTVSFHKIEIREYERTLGDNPSVSAGPPVTLDWKYNPDHQILHVDDYEKNKTSRDDFRLCENSRKSILRDGGVPRAHIIEVEKEVDITKRNRKESSLISDSQEKREAALESASRKFKRALNFSKKKEEQKLWKNASLSSARHVHSMNDLYTAGLNTSESIAFERPKTFNSPKKELRNRSSSTELPVVPEQAPASMVDSPKKELRKGSSPTELPVVREQAPASSSESVPADNDDDSWGFGYDEDEFQA